MISLRGLFWARRQNGEIDDEEPGNGINVEHAAIHKKFAQVFADVGDGGRVRRAEVDEKDAFQFVKWVKWLNRTKASFRVHRGAS